MIFEILQYVFLRVLMESFSNKSKSNIDELSSYHNYGFFRKVKTLNGFPVFGKNKLKTTRNFFYGFGFLHLILTICLFLNYYLRIFGIELIKSENIKIH